MSHEMIAELILEAIEDHIEDFELDDIEGVYLRMIIIQILEEEYDNVPPFIEMS